MACPVFGEVVDECDQLEVAAVFEDDELVFGFVVAVAAAGREREIGGYPGRGVQEGDVGD